MSETEASTNRATLSGGEAARSQAIAVIGIGCRYADARGPDALWEIVARERDTVREVPEHRIDLGYDIDHFYDPRPRIPGKISSRKGGFLEHPELFDPAAFGIAPRDALTMEPQQRLMVEVTWDALEDAGIVPASIEGERVAVLLGYMAEDYSRERAGVLGEEAVYRGHDVFTVGGMSHAVLSGRIAFLLGVTGPSLTLDTACSSSLITAHLACQSLRRRESNLAIAGGVNLFLSPEGNIALSRSGMLSMSGACKAFDAGADGFVRAEGAGVVVLKRLADAISDGDDIYAVIRGSGISTDGRDGGHMMAPGRKGQAQAMRDAYAEAVVDPATIHYVETHGTGTLIGDPVEIGALADVMGPGRDPAQPLRVASVKGNLGHAESASGVAGLIKACLMIRHRVLPAQLHFESPNPAIPWDKVPVVVQAKTEVWPFEGPARIGVNSFGISGTNAHVVLEAPIQTPRESCAAPKVGDLSLGLELSRTRPLVLALSAHDPAALQEMIVATREQLVGLGEKEARDLAFSHLAHRSQRPSRFSATADSVAGLIETIDEYLAGNPGPDVFVGTAAVEAPPQVVMVFPGQGSQWLGMGRDLLQREPVFAQSIEALDAAYSKYVDWSLISLLAKASSSSWAERLDQLQPVLVAIEIGIAELWRSWGIESSVVVGQSMGEIAAAHLAGNLSLEDVALLACRRGQAVSRARGEGAMALVALSREAVLSRIRPFEGQIEVAGENSPHTTVLSGDRDAIQECVAALSAAEVFARTLDVDFASHCFHMDPLLADFRQEVGGLRPSAGTIPFCSTVDGVVKVGEELGPDYWVRNLRQPVDLVGGLSSALDFGNSVVIEVSPHPTLSRSISEIAAAQGRQANYVPSLTREESGPASMARSLAALYVCGVSLDPKAFYPEAKRISLPLYPYQRERYWFSRRSRRSTLRSKHPFLGRASHSSVDATLSSWDFVLDVDSAGFVLDHRVAGEPAAPDSLAIEIGLAVAEAVYPGRAAFIDRMEMRNAFELACNDEQRRFVQVVFRREGALGGEFQIASRASEEGDGAWCLHARGRIRLEEVGGSDSLDTRVGESHLSANVDELVGSEPLPVDRYFAALGSSGVKYGSGMRTLREVVTGTTSGGKRVLEAKLMLPRSIESEWHAFRAHPALLEGALQLASLLEEESQAFEIDSIARIRLPNGIGSDCRCRVRREGADDEIAGTGRLRFEFLDREGRSLGELSGVQLRPRRKIEMAAAVDDTSVHSLVWHAFSPTVSEQAKSVQVERWILISDDGVQAGLLASELSKDGDECVFCEKTEDLAECVASMRSDSERPWGIVLLALRKSPGARPEEPRDRRAFRIASWAAEIRAYGLSADDFWFATRGLRSIGYEDPTPSSVSIEVAREIETFSSVSEMQHCHLFDASEALPPIELSQLANLIKGDSPDRQFVARGEKLFVPRWCPVAMSKVRLASRGIDLAPAEQRNFQIGRRQGGRERTPYRARACSEPLCGSAEVVVEVEAVSLSQHDVLSDLGLARAGSRFSTEIGMDFAGRVIECGEAVSQLRRGDLVMGLNSGAMSRRLVVKECDVVRAPRGLSATEAAALPLPYGVACFALNSVARVATGERVLVLSAAGGVGHALVQVALRAGARVTAVASHPDARSGLRAWGALCFESVDSIPTDVQFDVILGADSGAKLHASLPRLASGGRYLDLAPRADFEGPELGSLRLAPNRSFVAVDAVAVLTSEPERRAESLAWTRDQVESGCYAKLPVTAFPLRGLGRAQRYMAQKRQVGRVGLLFGAADALPIEPGATSVSSLTRRGAIVLSGATERLATAIQERFEAEGAELVQLLDDPAQAVDVLRSQVGEAPALWIDVRRKDESEPGLGFAPRFADSARTDVGEVDLVSVVLRPTSPAGALFGRASEVALWVDGLRQSEQGAARSVRESCVSAPIEGELDSLLDLLLNIALEQPPAATYLILADDEIKRIGTSEASSYFSLRVEEEGDDFTKARIAPGEFLALPLPSRQFEMERLVSSELAGVLGLSEEQRDSIELGRRLDSLGLDSLMTLELFTGLARTLGIDIDRSWFESIPTLREVAVTLSDRYARSLSE